MVPMLKHLCFVRPRMLYPTDPQVEQTQLEEPLELSQWEVEEEEASSLEAARQGSSEPEGTPSQAQATGSRREPGPEVIPEGLLASAKRLKDVEARVRSYGPWVVLSASERIRESYRLGRLDAELANNLEWISESVTEEDTPDFFYDFGYLLRKRSGEVNCILLKIPGKEDRGEAAWTSDRKLFHSLVQVPGSTGISKVAVGRSFGSQTEAIAYFAGAGVAPKVHSRFVLPKRLSRQ